MPARPRQHELDTEAIRYISSQLPSAWPHQENPGVSDYGKDLRVEIFENNRATAMEFVIQSKGHERFRIVNGDQIAERLKISTLNYYEKSSPPVLLAVYSAQEKQAKYLWIRPYIRKVLDVEKPDWRQLAGDSTITLHVPLGNHFDHLTHRAFLSHVESEHANRLMQSGGIPCSAPQLRGHIYSQLAFSPRLIQPKIGNYLARPRLTEALSQTMRSQSVFLHTDAGYGKTWLVKDLVAKSSLPICLWYTFAPDVINMQFYEEIASEFVRQSGVAQSRTLTYIHDRGREARPDEALGILIDEFQAFGRELWLVLEDVHDLADASLITAIGTLVTARPANLRVILTSRTPLPFGEAKLRAQGLLKTFERCDVAFQPEETREFLEQNLKIILSDQQIEYLQERTEGWIAAIALAGNALSDPSPDHVTQFFERLTGCHGDIYAFLAEQIYACLTPEHQLLLKRIGLARAIHADIVDLFTMRKDGGQVLKNLADQNSFLIETENKPGEYRIHSLFAEFLLTRFQDEEGAEAVENTHAVLAAYHAGHHDWHPAARHALAARDYTSAVKALENIAPMGLSLGYGYAVLSMISKIPEDVLGQSATLQEAKGQAALQVGDARAAAGPLQRAASLYRQIGDESATNRAEYLLAAVRYQAGDVSADQLFEVAQEVARKSYQRNDVFFGAQVELAIIQIGQALASTAPRLLPILLRQNRQLLVRLEPAERQFALLRAQAFAVLAHLLSQVATTSFLKNVSKVMLREKAGHQVPEQERISLAKQTIEQWDAIRTSYHEALKLAKEESEIEYTMIRLRSATDLAHCGTVLQLARAYGESQKDRIVAPPDEEYQKMLLSSLATIQECANFFADYHLNHALATAFCDAADIYDALGDLKNRDRLAREAVVVAEKGGLAKLVERGQGLLGGKNTFSSMRLYGERLQSDKETAAMNEEQKSQYVEHFLQAYEGDTDTDGMRKAVWQDVEDMVAAAKQRVEWCNHLQIMQDLRHTQSLETLYRTTPNKYIVCQLLHQKSLAPGGSFEELWFGFKGMYCLGCLQRSLTA